MNEFAGFTPAAWAFLDALAAGNTKANFDAHRDIYEREIATPSKQLVDALGDALAARVHPGLHGDPRIGRSLFRINRDVRFAADKTPYKTHIDFLLWIGENDPRSSPAAIMRITASTVLLGAGRIGLRGQHLDRYRSAVTDPEHGPRLRKFVDQLVARGAELSDPDRVRAPRPHPEDHPNGDLLRRDGFHLSHTQPHPDTIADATFVAWCCDQLARYAPLLDWFTRTDEPTSRG